MRGPVEIHGATVVAEPIPGANDLGAAAAASASTVGQRLSHAVQRGTTLANWVCWSITSLTSTAYGSRV